MKSYGWVGVLLLVTSEYCLLKKIEPIYSWFYCFAWWSYILIADSLLLRIRGRSLFSERRAELLQMLPISVMIWLLFESYNLVIRNWAYSGVPAELWERWTGYTMAFATVLPGIFITGDLVETLFQRKGSRPASQCEIAEGKLSTSGASLFLAIGVVFSAAPLIWPRFMFPAVWIGPIFLLDPLLERAGFRSLRMQMAAGQWQRIWSLLLGGLVCGALWEFWNFWAGSKWIYTVPFFGNWKIFEMPLLGFLGFPPFALECWILYHLLRALVGRLRLLPGHAVLYIGTVVLCVLMYRQIDAHTVVRFAENFYRSLGLWARG